MRQGAPLAAAHAVGPEQPHPGGAGEAGELILAHRPAVDGAQIGQGEAGGDEAEPAAGGGEAAQQGGQALILELAGRKGGGGRRVLQGLQTIEDQQRAPLADQPGEPPAFVVGARRAARHRGVAEKARASARNRSEEAAVCSRVPWL